jgi:hypothetical protein
MEVIMLTIRCHRVIVAAAIAVTLSFASTASSQDATDDLSKRIRDVPEGIAQLRLKQIVGNFNRVYAPQAEITSIEYFQTVDDVDATVTKMMETFAVVDTEDDPEKPVKSLKLLLRKDLEGTSEREQERLRSSLASNLDAGDFAVMVTLRVNNSSAQSLNSISADGTAFSGVLFGTARIPAIDAQSVQLPNTVCTTVVLTRYLWGAPAETAQGCVRVDCDANKPENCRVTTASCFGGFFGDCKLIPLVGSGGSISRDCGDAFFNYVWTTGFKKVKVGAKGATLEVEGRIGQQGNGGFTARECCKRSSARRSPVKRGKS